MGPFHDFEPLLVGNLFQGHLDRNIGRSLFFPDTDRRSGLRSAGYKRGHFSRPEQLFLRNFVRVSVASFMAGHNAHARALADAENSALKFPLFQENTPRDTVLNVNLAEFATLAQGLADDLVQVAQSYLRLFPPAVVKKVRQKRGSRSQGYPSLETPFKELAARNVFKKNRLESHACLLASSNFVSRHENHNLKPKG